MTAHKKSWIIDNGTGKNLIINIKKILSNIEEVTNRYQTKTLYDNNKNNENNGITERNNDNNIKGIKKILKKYDFLNKNVKKKKKKKKILLKKKK